MNPTIWRFNLNTKFLWLFSDRRANINITDCESCTAGSFCNGYGLSNPSGLCSAGYYCPGGQSSDSPVDYACSPGHYCLIGSWNQTGCPSGTYQAHWQRNTCDDCPAGFYCRALGELIHRGLVVPYDDIVNIGSGNGLVPDGTKLLPEPMMTNHLVTNHLVGFTWGQFHRKCLRYISLKITDLRLHRHLPGPIELAIESNDHTPHPKK